MTVASIKPDLQPLDQSPQNAPLAQQRRELAHLTKTINDSGVLGSQNELEFAVDRASRHPVMRLVDRVTRQVVMQIPPEYVLQLAETLQSKLAAE